METTDELVVAKKKLDESLGDNFKIYLKTMRQWFTQKLTKEEFDRHVDQSLSADSVMAHNQFLLALFNKCSHLAETDDNSRQSTTTDGTTDQKTDNKNFTKIDSKPKPIVKPLRKKLKALKKLNFDRRFDPSAANENLYLRSTKLLDDCQKLSKVNYCYRESVLPDHFMSHLRVFVICWEMGLDGVQDNAVKLCNAALRDFMKTILTEMFASRSSYRLRDNRFKYSIGCPPINPYLKNAYPLLQKTDYTSNVINPETGESITLRPTVDEATNEAMYWMACGGQLTNKRVHSEEDNGINLRHLFHCLKANHNLIPSFSVRCNASYKTAIKLSEIESNSVSD